MERSTFYSCELFAGRMLSAPWYSFHVERRNGIADTAILVAGLDRSTGHGTNVNSLLQRDALANCFREQTGYRHPRNELLSNPRLGYVGVGRC